MKPRGSARPGLARSLTAGLLVSVGMTSSGQAGTPIVVDGLFADWAGRVPVAVDRAGDTAGLDLQRLWIADDADFLFLRLELGAEVSLQSATGLQLLLDADDDPGTGEPRAGLGVDVWWDFGERAGRVSGPEGTAQITHSDVGLVTLPTHEARAFEIALRRTGALAGDRVRVRIVETLAGDSIPDGAGGVTYVPAPTGPPPAIDAARRHESIRLVAWNLESDALFDDARRPAIGRILNVLDPDVIGLQEIYAHDAAAVTRALGQVDARFGDWHAQKLGLDLVLVSRLPIEQGAHVASFEKFGSVAAWRLDTRSILGRPLALVLAHWPCCRGTEEPTPDDRRQQLADATVAFVRDGRRPAGLLAGDAALVVLGDLNLVGRRSPLTTLEQGVIADAAGFGSGQAPSADGLALRDLAPRHTHAPLAWTWFKATSRFSPGRLDFALVPPSIGAAGFLLETTSLPPPRRAAWGLEELDSAAASDHLPVVVDLHVTDEVAAAGRSPRE